MEVTDAPDDVRRSDEESPEFEEWETPGDVVRGGPIRERLLDVIVQVREPTKVAEIAERADCTKAGARPHLEWFVELGVLDKLADNPALFVRNEAYFEFRRITELTRRYDSPAEVEDAIDAYRAREGELRDSFGEPSPDRVDLSAVDYDDLDEASDRLSEWRTVRRRTRELHEVKRRLATDPGTGSDPTSPTP